MKTRRKLNLNLKQITLLLLACFASFGMAKAQEPTAPTVTTASVININSTVATGRGNVTADGGAEVTERGICWGMSENPTTSGSHAAASEGGTGEFTVGMTGLTASTTYHVRAYATNSAGTAYGEDVSFTTSSVFTMDLAKGSIRFEGNKVYYTNNSGTPTEYTRLDNEVYQINQSGSGTTMHTIKVGTENVYDRTSDRTGYLTSYGTPLNNI